MKIYDCFTFNNEFEVLELRLAELSPYVDEFIISESKLTHSGKDKPLHLSERLAEDNTFLSKYKNRITIVEADLTESEGAWSRENKQRNALGFVADKATEEDIILLSDADEIPNRFFIDEVKNLKRVKGPFPVLAKQIFHYYTFQYRKESLCHGTIAVTKEALAETSMQKLRDDRFHMNYILNGGWHLSFFGGTAQIKDKIQSFAHTEFAGHAEESSIDYRVKAGQDIFGRKGDQDRLIVCGDLQPLPEVVVARPDKYRHLIG